jgi:hypothetical protein
VILDTEGNIFDCFTPVEWESRVFKVYTDKSFKADDSQKSFLFSLKNPHNFPARRFALKAEKKHEAIYCQSTRGPHFWDIAVSDNCNVMTSTYTHFGYSSTNDTGLDCEKVSTGWRHFQVKEIEVFEITD